MKIQYLVVVLSLGLTLNIANGLPTYEAPDFKESVDITSDELIGNWYVETLFLERKPLRNDFNACMELAFTNQVSSANERNLQAEKLNLNITLSSPENVMSKIGIYLKNNTRTAFWTDEKYSSSGMQVFIAAKNYLVLIFCNTDYMECKKIDSAFLISRQGHTLDTSEKSVVMRSIKKLGLSWTVEMCMQVENRVLETQSDIIM